MRSRTVLTSAIILCALCAATAGAFPTRPNSATPKPEPPPRRPDKITIEKPAATPAPAEPTPAPAATPGTAFGIEGPAQDESVQVPRREDELPLIKIIPDPIEGFNRTMYAATDGLAHYILVPTGKGYRIIAPHRARKSVKNFGDNLAFPVRLVNNLLQGKLKGAGVETGRFVVNTTVGVAGLFDPARSWGMKPHKEDFGQTFGKWGMGPGFYFFIPVEGPSSPRDGVGLIGDTLLNPVTYIPFLGTFLRFNNFSLEIDEYEIFRESESDPYVLAREFWGINREKDVRDFAITAKDYSKEPAQTLEAIHCRPFDRKFWPKPPQHKVKIEKTGQKLPYSYWLQDSPAPVVFVLPGASGHRNSEMVRFIAMKLHKEGFSVVSISSVFNHEFIENASTTAVPGYTPVDAMDISAALEAVARDLDERYGDRITWRALMGVSLGGLHTLFIADAAKARGGTAIDFARYVAVNPPVDPLYALNKLDACYNSPKRWPEEERARRVEETLMKAAIVFQEPMDFKERLPFDKTESEFLIGVSYRYGLRNAIYESQRKENLGILKTRAGWFRRQPHYDEVTTYSFRGYLAEFVLPYYRTRMDGSPSLEALGKAAGLRSLRGELATNPRIRVITNWNDFVVSPTDVAWLKGTLKERIVVFPEGGHLGNLHVAEVQAAVAKALKE